MEMQLERHDEMAVITLNRPHALNALNAALIRDIGAAIDRLAARLLGRHVGGGSEDQPGRGGVLRHSRRQRKARVGGLRLPRFGEPEIEDLDRPVWPELDVGRFEITVDDALLVRRLESFGDLERDGDRLGAGDRAARDSLGEILAFDEFHDEEGHGA